MNIRNRIVEEVEIAAGDLSPNPLNWRTHPVAQQEAMRGVLAEIGLCDRLKAVRLLDGRVMILDGHLRAELLPADMMVPVAILDLSESEQAKFLATFDSITSKAGVDEDVLDSLLREVETTNDAVAQLLDDLATESGIVPGDEDGGGEESIPERWDILVECGSEERQCELLEMFDREGLQCRALIA